MLTALLTLTTPLPAILVSLAGISVAHFVGDYVLQSRWMGENKSKSWKPLLAHILVYTITLMIFSSMIFGWQVGVVYGLANGLLHLLTDYFTSRMSRKAYESKNLSKFWLIIGADQTIHQICLISTLIFFPIT